MNKLVYLSALCVVSLAACSTTSGPTFSASELQPRDGVRTFQVDCHGLLSGPQTCMKAASEVCGDQPVRVIDSARAIRNHADPATLVFQCGAAPDQVAPPAPEATPAPAALPVAVEHVNLSADALFATGQSTLTPTARATLDTLLNAHANYTYAQVTVTGYTDSVGSDAYNLALSKRRAESVATYLKTHGLKADTWSVSGRGKTDPVASNATAEGRASNRRVEIALRGNTGNP
ncbi:OmpA family protein [Burkholderia contaminans]|uniref:OmpA family protein n=1 Tax=Burkholderia contaminans TaxID=488447 RepID=UPI0024168A58|nr:OmpA family protein [Burkholderia contaminans]WFN15043.1 OmpA family protein [Burkholderia contaminans]